MVNENIIILLAIIIIIIAIYYIIITYTKHTSIIEKFSESKPLHGNVKFRNCQIYFTKDKEKCDTNYEQDDSDTCKYYIHIGEKYFSFNDGDGQFDGSDLSDQKNVSEGFPGSEN